MLSFSSRRSAVARMKKVITESRSTFREKSSRAAASSAPRRGCPRTAAGSNSHSCRDSFPERRQSHRNFAFTFVLTCPCTQHPLKLAATRHSPCHNRFGYHGLARRCLVALGLSIGLGCPLPNGDETASFLQLRRDQRGVVCARRRRCSTGFINDFHYASRKGTSTSAPLRFYQARPGP
jgi:hypothetical protein